VGRLDEARNAFERALTFDAEAMDSWGSHGDALIGLGRHDEALKAFDRAIRLDPKDPDNWRSKAIALRALGRAREALEAERQEQLLVGGNAVAP
jgi:tetratricopeptide (TPR) repeat protein